MRKYILRLIAIIFLFAMPVALMGQSVTEDVHPDSGGLANLVDDTTPQLGADLDAQGFNLDDLGVLFLKEQAEADADVAGSGQIWVNTATPNELFFTDDAGTDAQLGTSTTPSGSDTEVQYNDSSAFGANSEFTIDKTTFILNAQGFLATPDVAEDGVTITIPGSYTGNAFSTSGELSSDDQLILMVDDTNKDGFLVKCKAANCNDIWFGQTINDGSTLNAGWVTANGGGRLESHTFGTRGVGITANGLLAAENDYIGWSNTTSTVSTLEAAFFYDGASKVYFGTAAATPDKDFEAKDISGDDAQITAGSGTGLTVDEAGALRSSIYKVTLDYTGLSAAALTATHTIATLPAKTKIVGMIADTTTQYAGTGVTDADIVVGIDSGDLDAFLLTHDVDTATIIVGDEEEDMGALIDDATSNSMAHAYINWAGTTVISVQITTVGANTDQLTAGITTYYIETVKYD